jgi:potassium-transporting ATPase KdpC subunit
MDIVRQLRPAILLLLIMTVILGIVYPLFITGLAQTAFGGQANGSLITDKNGQVVGSSLIGQNFTGPQYFHPRPSAAGTNGYDATASGGSNLGPTSSKLIGEVQQRAQAYRAENGLGPNDPVPVDAVTASASGLDPDITPANALLQVRRVATARSLPESDVRGLVESSIEGRFLWVLGEPRVNVLKLNIALDNLK